MNDENFRFEKKPFPTPNDEEFERMLNDPEFAEAMAEAAQRISINMRRDFEESLFGGQRPIDNQKAPNSCAGSTHVFKIGAMICNCGKLKS